MTRIEIFRLSASGLGELYKVLLVPAAGWSADVEAVLRRQYPKAQGWLVLIMEVAV